MKGGGNGSMRVAYVAAALVCAGCGPTAEGAQTVEAAGDHGQLSATLTGPAYLSGEPSMTDPLLVDLALAIQAPPGAVVRTIGQGNPGNGCHFQESFPPDITVGSDGTGTASAVASHGRASGCRYEVVLELYADGRNPDTATRGMDDVARPELEIPVR
jgi:hypothetical protein